MLDLEVQVGRVANAEVRPLVTEAYRCYTVGAARAAIVLTWTAVCTDLIDKIATLYQSGEAQAAALTRDVEAAQGKLDHDSIVVMQGVEASVLDIAVTLELIDATQRVQLERLREDRNLCAHPSLRPLGELFTPPLEYARAHLAVALDAVLIHPASQGRKVVEAFAAHILDPGFVGDPLHIADAFFRRVRPTARRRVVEFAARHAVLEPPLPEHPAVAPADLADRMAKCLRIFAAEDRTLVAEMIGKFAERWSTAQAEIQLRTLVRLGDLDAFWSGLNDAMRSQLDALVRGIGDRHKDKDYWEAPSLDATEAGALALVAIAEVRTALPSLEAAMTALSAPRRAEVIAQRPSPYFAELAASLLEEAPSFDEGWNIQRIAVMPCAAHMTTDQLRATLKAWAGNSQCWGRGTIENAVRLYHAMAALGPARDAEFRGFLNQLAERAGTTYVVNYQNIHDSINRQLADLLSPVANAE